MRSKYVLKKIHLRYSFLLTLVLLNSCALFKSTSSKNSPPVADAILLDTVSVTATDTTPHPAYQAAETRITDILHTKLEVKFDWDKQYLFGQATITAKPYFYSQNTVVFDARGMEIKEVSLIQRDGTRKQLVYTYGNDRISIDMDKTYSRSDTFKLYIDYTSKPNELKSGGSQAIKSDKGLYFINADGKDPDKPLQIWTQGETQSNSVWFPTNDVPNEKMTEEIAITVDKKYTTLSNGELEFQKENADGTRTDYWKMDLPHSVYLVMMAVGEFSIVKDLWKGREVSYYVEKEYAQYAKNIFGNTPEMMEYFSTKLGVSYPWNKYAQVVVRDYVSGAMENTSATLHGDFIQQTDRERIDADYEDVISHELFHQWFGDLVTTESWANLPLNEAFATYGEYLWKDYKYGRMEADLHLSNDLDTYLNEGVKEPKKLIRYHYTNREDMFDAHSYQKGGLVLHMLRKYVGDEAFFAALKLYLEINKFDNAEIHHLRLAFEKITGEDLHWFFDQWFMQPGHPQLTVRHNFNQAEGKYTVSIEQSQDASKFPIFKLPIEVDIYSNGKVERKRILLTKHNQDFDFSLTTRPDLVNVDAEKATLCTKNEYGKSVREWIFQLNNAPLYRDKFEALIELFRQESDSLAAEALYSSLDNKFWYLRYAVIPEARIHLKTRHDQVKNKIISIALNDQKSLVRAQAISFLADTANFKTQKQFIEVYMKALKDQSYSVLGEALYALAKADSSAALAEASKFENEKDKSIKSTVLSIYSSYGNDKNIDFFVNSSAEFSELWKISYYSWLGSFLLRCNEDASINKALPVFEAAAADEAADAYSKYFAKKGLRDLIEKYEAKEKQEKDSVKLAQIVEKKKKIENILGKFK